MMTHERAIEIMAGYYQDGNLVWPRGGAEYVSYHKGNDYVTLDGDFTADELEAIAYLMKETQ